METDSPTSNRTGRLLRKALLVPLVVLGLLLVIDIGLCVIGTLFPHFPIWPWWTSHSQSEKPLSADLKLVERNRTEFYPFFGMAHNDRRWMIPGFMVVTVPEGQWVEKAGVKIYEPKPDDSSMWNLKDCQLSPDGRFLLAVDDMHVQPFEILDLENGTQVVIPPAEIEGHYFTYPFTFLSWRDDSGSFTAEVTGTYVKNPGMNDAEFLAYREVWSFTAADGSGKRVSRQEQPWKKDLKWEDPGESQVSKPDGLLEGAKRP